MGSLVVFQPVVLRMQLAGIADPLTLALVRRIQDCPGGVRGACCGGMLAEVTATRDLEIEDFYPDEYSEIYLAGDGGEIWRAAVRDLDRSRPILVRTSRP